MAPQRRGCWRRWPWPRSTVPSGCDHPREPPPRRSETMAERTVAIREVGPRDGLQREAPLEPARRLALIDGLAGCGFPDMEVAAFVSERAVPSMAGAAEVIAGLPSDAECTWWALVPNMTGAERAMAAGVD